jgi:hypothetical protein
MDWPAAAAAEAALNIFMQMPEVPHRQQAREMPEQQA